MIEACTKLSLQICYLLLYCICLILLLRLYQFLCTRHIFPTFRGYNDHISIKNLCFQMNNVWMVLLDMTTITRIPCQSLVLSIFLVVTDLFVNKYCVACNKFYNALRGVLYSLNNYRPPIHLLHRIYQWDKAFCFLFLRTKV